MNISDNILKEHLKNVYFLSGGAYGGKTTMSKLIEEKYGFVRFRQGDHSDEYTAMADSEFQPALSANRTRNMDWHRYFSQPSQQYSGYLGDCLNEETEFAVVDLIMLSRNQKVIADVAFVPEVLKKISEPSRVVLLFAPEEMTRRHYFDRDDKQDVYQLIKSFPDADELLHNVIEAIHYNSASERKSYYDSGFYCIERREDDTIENTLKKIERHFGLSDQQSSATSEA